MTRVSAFGLATLLAFGAAACGGGDQQTQEQQPAAQQQQAPTQGQQQGQQIEVTDDELRAFVTATRRLQEAAKTVKAQMEEGQGRQQARQELKEKRDQILEDVGLDPMRYRQIRKAIEADKTLQQRYMEMRKQAEQQQ